VIVRVSALKARFKQLMVSWYRKLLIRHGVEFDERYVWD